MSLVRCSFCHEDVAERHARRELTVWARTGRGGTMSDVKRPKPTGRWCCSDCERSTEAGPMDEMFPAVES